SARIPSMKAPLTFAIGVGELPPIKVIRGRLAGAWARAMSGHEAAPPSSVMNSRRFTAQCLRASTEKDSTTGGSAAVRDFEPAYDRYGSLSTFSADATRRLMSALPPTATKSLPRSELSRRATTGCEQSQQWKPLFDHLVSERE